MCEKKVKLHFLASNFEFTSKIFFLKGSEKSGFMLKGKRNIRECSLAENWT